MKKVISALAITLMTSGLAIAQSKPITSLEIGSPIPNGDVQMVAASGGKVSLDMVKTKKGLLVMFSCNTCPYVVKAQSRTIEMVQHAVASGIGMIIINSNEAQRGNEDSYKEMKKYALKQGYKVPYVMDDKSALADAFGATRTPEVFLFDGTGTLVYKGAMEDNPSNPAESKSIFLKKAIDNMVAGEPIDPNNTKSIGCAIKRL